MHCFPAGLTGDQLEKLRTSHRLRVLDTVAQNVRSSIAFPATSFYELCAEPCFASQVEHFNEKLGILTQVQDICSRCSSVAERLLGNRTFEAASQGSPVAFSDEEDEVGGGESLEVCLHMLLMRLKDLSDGASSLATELSLRQSKWLALSSQLKACPLGKLPSLDLQSWLSQVREGKISGAGHDSSYSSSSLSEDQLGYVSPTQLIESSDMFVESSSESTLSDDRSWSCLMSAREDLKPSHVFLSGTLCFVASSSSSCT